MSSSTLPSPLATESRAASLHQTDAPAFARSSVAHLGHRLASGAVRLCDLLLLTASLLTAVNTASLASGRTLLALRVPVAYLLLWIALLATWSIVHSFTSLYQPRVSNRLAGLLWRVPFTAAADALILLPVFFGHRSFLGILHPFLLFLVLSTAGMMLLRTGVLVFEDRIRPSLRKPRTVILCGSGPLARTVMAELAGHPDLRYQVAGFIDNRPQPSLGPTTPWLGPLDQLDGILMRQPIDEVVIGLPLRSHFAEVQSIVQTCGRAGIPVGYSLRLFDTEIAKHHTVSQDSGGRVTLEMVHRDQRLILKTLFDRVAAAGLLLLLSPFLTLIALAVRLSSPGPILFAQDRFGLNKRRFRMFKFRSMVVDAEARMAALEHLNETSGPMFKIRHDPRITRVGAFLRATSLDELPQLLNVLRGEMSLVGPRPFSLRDVGRFDEPWLMRRFSVKPGITGLWQVSGRSDVEFDQAIRLDLLYIDKWNLALDLHILLRTFSAVLRRSGAY